ncbi:MAG: DNA/RNA non-specific endonuclease [Ignavibacteria bacterium]|jgi:endonuclease G
MMNITVLLFLILFGTFGIHAQSTRNTKNIHAPWGFPMDANPKDDHLIERKQYVLSYNEHLNVANWVAWQLNATWYGSTPRRSGKFITDTSLPESFTRITHDDYTKSGYDRGHLVRSEERTANIEDNTSTFLMSNILPQTPTLNQQTWLSLEYECERLCKSEGKVLYVIAGGVFSGIPTRLNGKVAVPDSCWKIVLILEKGQSIKDVSSKTSIIAVMMHNGRYEKTNNDWNLYTTSVDAIERSTGYDFFRDMPDQVENVLEAVIYR